MRECIQEFLKLSLEEIVNKSMKDFLCAVLEGNNKKIVEEFLMHLPVECKEGALEKHRQIPGKIPRGISGDEFLEEFL